MCTNILTRITTITLSILFIVVFIDDYIKIEFRNKK